MVGNWRRRKQIRTRNILFIGWASASCKHYFCEFARSLIYSLAMALSKSKYSLSINKTFSNRIIRLRRRKSRTSSRVADGLKNHVCLLIAATQAAKAFQSKSEVYLAREGFSIGFNPRCGIYDCLTYLFLPGCWNRRSTNNATKSPDLPPTK